MTNATSTTLDMMLRLDGKVAVVTGGSKGIGRGIVRRLAEAGAKVVVADIDMDVAVKVVAETQQAGGVAFAMHADVAVPDDARALISSAVKRFGRVDILVNNAGVYPFRPALDMTAAEWDRVQNINLRGPFLLSQEFARQAISQGAGGVIINIGSIDSIHPSGVGLAAYDASKGGLLMFTRNFALEVAKHGIRVNMIAPGGIATEGAGAGLSGMSKVQIEAMMKEFSARIPMGRMGTPDEIGTMALVMATPLSAYMTGAVVVVDGGRLVG